MAWASSKYLKKDDFAFAVVFKAVKAAPGC
jgi:hypothetical protein